MKKTVKHIARFLPLLLLAAVACQDSWNRHYSYDKTLGGEDLLTTLKAEASYSRFVKLIEIAGRRTNWPVRSTRLRTTILFPIRYIPREILP